MISLVNLTAIHACTKVSSVWDKANYCNDTITLIEIVAGAILCLIGGLALNGVLFHQFITPTAAKWMIAAGSCEIGIGILLRYLDSCTEIYCLVRQYAGTLQEMLGDTYRKVTGQTFIEGWDER